MLSLDYNDYPTILALLDWAKLPCEISDGSGVLKTVQAIFESEESVAISLGLSQWSTCNKGNKIKLENFSRIE